MGDKTDRGERRAAHERAAGGRPDERADRETPTNGLDHLRESARGRHFLGPKEDRPTRRGPGAGLRRIALWLIVLAVALDIAAAVSYTLDQRFFRSLADKIVDEDRPTKQEILERFVDFAYSDLERPTYDKLASPFVKLYYKYNPFHPSARDVVKYGCDYRGGCGSSSRVLLALLDASGIEARSMVLRDEEGRRVHAVVNALIDGRWAVADPLYGLVFTQPDGTLVTAEELHEDRALFAANAERNPAYPQEAFNYDNFALMNWKKIPVLLPAIRWVLAHTIGEERTASISRPKIWMYPLPACALSLTALVLLFAGVVTVLTRRGGAGGRR